MARAPAWPLIARQILRASVCDLITLPNGVWLDAMRTA